MAVQLEDKTQHVQYLSTCLQQFLMECGRTHAILNNTVLQSDQEDFIISLLKMVATAMGSNIAVRQSPAYTSQAQGSVERFHRTLMGQVGAIKLQLENNYGMALLYNRQASHPKNIAILLIVPSKRKWDKFQLDGLIELNNVCSDLDIVS